MESILFLFNCVEDQKGGNGINDGNSVLFDVYGVSHRSNPEVRIRKKCSYEYETAMSTPMQSNLKPDLTTGPWP